ncbi:MAG: sugar transferase [Anaerolineaceae bacterium]|nr:sugar transferase [Anaerolineaceae bacterium]
MQWRLFTILLVFSDGLFIGLAFLTAYWIRFNLNIPLFQLEVMPSLPYYRTLVVLMVPSWLTIFWIKGLYNRNNLLGGTKEYSELFNASTMGFVMVIAGSFILRELDFARGWLLLSWVLSFLFTAAGRFFIRRFVYYLRQYGYFVSQAVIVGANEEGILLAEQLVQWKTSGFHILGFVDKKIKPGDRIYKNLICLGNLEQIADVIDQYEITDLILATSAISSRDKMVEIFKRYGMDSDINVRFSSGLYEIITTGLTVNQFAFVPLVGVNPVRMTGVDQAIKMIVDILLTSVGLVLLSPIMVFIALLVHFDSPGPIIHRRRVVGMNGKHFDAFKFRTMYVNGDELLAGRPELQQELAENHKLKVDPRITKVGKYLRKLSLDELPQLFNVLRGEMSLVGPRMITQEEMAKYDKWDLNLVTVRPGITGLWQVSGRSDISYEERVRLDMYYIRNWNIWLDVQLILQTIPAVLKSRGAY